MKSYVKVWEFRVKSGSDDLFEKISGTGGDWECTMKKAEGFMKTELLRDVEKPRRYLTLDYWNSAAAFDNFKIDFPAEYRALDERCEALTEREMLLASFFSTLPKN